MTQQHWDKAVVQKLVALGLSYEHARIVLGEIAEQRQQADREGYKRGYNNGCEDTDRENRDE